MDNLSHDQFVLDHASIETHEGGDTDNSTIVLLDF